MEHSAAAFFFIGTIVVLLSAGRVAQAIVGPSEPGAERLDRHLRSRLWGYSLASTGDNPNQTVDDHG
jgi:hypothetical protein